MKKHYDDIRDVRLGDLVVTEGRVGEVIAVYDRKKCDYTTDMRIKFMDGRYRKGYALLNQVTKYPNVKTRKDLYNLIKDDELSGQEVVEVIRQLRDDGKITLNLPPR